MWCSIPRITNLLARSVANNLHVAAKFIDYDVLKIGVGCARRHRISGEARTCRAACSKRTQNLLGLEELRRFGAERQNKCQQL